MNEQKHCRNERMWMLHFMSTLRPLNSLRNNGDVFCWSQVVDDAWRKANTHSRLLHRWTLSIRCGLVVMWPRAPKRLHVFACECFSLIWDQLHGVGGATRDFFCHFCLYLYWRRLSLYVNVQWKSQHTVQTHIHTHKSSGTSPLRCLGSILCVCVAGGVLWLPAVHLSCACSGRGKSAASVRRGLSNHDTERERGFLGCIVHQQVMNTRAGR